LLVIPDLIRNLGFTTALKVTKWGVAAPHSEFANDRKECGNPAVGEKEWGKEKEWLNVLIGRKT
jgi:hypothetical protein